MDKYFSVGLLLKICSFCGFLYRQKIKILNQFSFRTIMIYAAEEILFYNVLCV